MPTALTIAELLYLFRDGQADKSIGPEPFQNLIASLHLSSGAFNDLPPSPAGLAAGRLWLSSGVVMVSTGVMPASLSGNFLGAGTASLTANASTVERAARSTMRGTVTFRGDGLIVNNQAFSRAFSSAFGSPNARTFSSDFSSAFS